MRIAINPRTQKKLEILQADLPHAVLLSGRPGVGLATIARQLAGKDLLELIEPVDKEGNVDQETGTISVDIIRSLYEKTRTKQDGRRVIVIDDAERMSLGSQAAFLKLLEEPSLNTHFVLTSHSGQLLLPTVRSRLQTTHIEPITNHQTLVFIDNLNITDPQKKLQLEFLANGQPAELTRLATDSKYFEEQTQIVQDARTLLTGSVYERLLVANLYHKDRPSTLQLIDSTIALANYSIRTQPQAKLIDKLERLLQARDKIEANCNARLQMTAFVVQ